MSTDDSLQPPQSDSKDLTRSFIKTFISVLSFGTAAELFDFLVQEPIEKRLIEWRENLFTRLKTIEQTMEEFSPETLVTNEAFKTTFAYAAREAAFTHQQETLDALRNAVLNSALPNAPDADRQKMFVQLAGELTPLHLKLLLLFEKLGGVTKAPKLSNPNWRRFVELKHLADAIEAEYPEMQGHFHTYVQALHDLHQQGLLVDEHPERNTPSRLSSDGSELSQFAREFLKFIKSPLDGKVQG
ncbi:MAG: hypothetical protein K8S97_00895 [Anaerolineae bacterium]|nr:hypothetical protein [Anaerolineae bacterium]